MWCKYNHDHTCFHRSSSIQDLFIQFQVIRNYIHHKCTHFQPIFYAVHRNKMCIDKEWDLCRFCNKENTQHMIGQPYLKIFHRMGRHIHYIEEQRFPCKLSMYWFQNKQSKNQWYNFSIFLWQSLNTSVLMHRRLHIMSSLHSLYTHLLYRDHKYWSICSRVLLLYMLGIQHRYCYSEIYHQCTKNSLTQQLLQAHLLLDMWCWKSNQHTQE